MKHDIESYVITIKRKDAYAPYSTCGQPSPTPQADSTAQRTSAPAPVTAAPAAPSAASAPSSAGSAAVAKAPAPTALYAAVSPVVRRRARPAPTPVTAPLPGIIIDLKVLPCDLVTKGQELAVLEAMKMENSILAPRSGMVKSIAVSPGDSVSEGTVLLVIE